MKKITIELDGTQYQQLNDLINWINLDNQFTQNKTNHTIEEFIKGAAISKLDEANRILFQSNGTKMKNKFKQIAKERKIKQADIVRLLDINKSTLSLIFNNENQPRSDIFFKIWAILGSPPIHKCIYFED